MTFSGLPIHIAVANSIPEPGYHAAQLIAPEGVHRSKRAEDNGLSPTMFCAYAANAIPELGLKDLAEGAVFIDRFHPTDEQGPEVRCTVHTLRTENGLPETALRVSVEVDDETVGTAYIEITHH